MLEILLPGFTVNCHFLPTSDIEMNVNPEDIDSFQKAEAVFQLMSDMAVQLNREVYLVPEFGSATRENIRSLALCVADPRGPSLRCLWF